MKPLSASQISTFLSCQRSWGFTYLEGKRLPGTKATELGGAIHKDLENWTRHATAPTLPQAKALMSLIPPPGIAEAETALTFSTPSSPWRGFIDLVYSLDDNGNPVKAFTTPHVVVVDFKSTSNMSYAKSADHLANEDSQSGLYGGWAFGRGAERVTGRWLYTTTRGAVQTRPVEFAYARGAVQITLDKLDVDAKEVQRLYSIRPKASELPANLGHCSAYGGCGHASYCDRSPSKGNHTMTSPDSFLAFVDKTFPKQNAVPPPPPAPPIPSTSLAFEGAENSDPDARAKAFIAAIPPPPSFNKPAAPPAPPTSSIPVVSPYGGQVLATFSVPPLPPAPPSLEQQFLKATNAELSGADGAAEEVARLESLLPGGKSLDRPRVESGTINPPEAPTHAPSSPEEAAVMVPVVQKADTHVPDELDTMDRDSLKRVCVALGLATESSRYQEPRLRSMIREFAQAQSQSVAEVVLAISIEEAKSKTGQIIVDGMADSRATLENTQLTEEELGAIKEVVATSPIDAVWKEEFRQIVREEIRAFFGSLGK